MLHTLKSATLLALNTASQSATFRVKTTCWAIGQGQVMYTSRRTGSTALWQSVLHHK